jgi:hypothetical protein
LDHFFVKRDYRSRALVLLSSFIQSEPPHLYQVLQTRLFENVIQCLQKDTSTTVVSLALTTLIMLLPNMPSSIVSHLPTLFNIYARLLFWDRERAAPLGDHGSAAEVQSPVSSPSWEQCVYSAEMDGVRIPHLLGYFTILYGLYPINFMDYIRKPQRYLRHANVPNADDIEVQPSEIRHRSEQYRQWHLLHPNFYSLTIESEKTDFSRWIKSESPDVVAECAALCLLTEPGSASHGESSGRRETTSPFPGDEAEKEEIDPSLLSGSIILRSLSTQDLRPFRAPRAESPASSRAQSTLIRRSSQSSHPSTRDSMETRTKEVGVDSPTLPAHLVISTSQTDLQDMINSNRANKSGLHQSLTNDSVPSLALSHHDSTSEKPSASRVSLQPASAGGALSPAPSPDNNEQVADFRRQIVLLKNDLNFERYLKQQHMSHIGTLQRRHVREAASEAEMQSLLSANRNLKRGLEEAKTAEQQAKKESEKTRSISKKWELDLSTKLRNLREEQKKWLVEGATLKRDLEASAEECEKLRKLVCDAEVKELNSRQMLQAGENSTDEAERLRKEVERLGKVDRESQAKSRQLEATRREAAEADSQGESLRMQVKACETDMQRMRDYYESQIVVLNTKLQEALRSRAGRPTGDDTSSMVANLLEASRAKQLELQKQHSQLMRKYTVLQSHMLEMRASTEASQSRSSGGSKVSSLTTDRDAELSAILDPLRPAARGRTQRGFSDPESFEAPALDTLSSTASTGTAVYRSTTPPNQMRAEAVPGAVPGNVSPQSERYHGRGGSSSLRQTGSWRRSSELTIVVGRRRAERGP